MPCATGDRRFFASSRALGASMMCSSGPVTIMVHMASVWVPFTSESKEAVASYPEIQKELRLALQSTGRKLGMYLRRRMKVKQEGERRNILRGISLRPEHESEYLLELSGPLYARKTTSTQAWPRWTRNA